MDLFAVLFKCFAVLVVLYGVYSAWRVVRRLNAVFAKLAARYNGQVRRRFFFDFPRLTLEHSGRRMQVSIVLAEGGDVLVAKLHLFFERPGLKLKLYLLPSNLVERLAARAGFHDVKVGNEAFDRAYIIVKAQPVAAAPGFLTAPVQQALLDIRDLSPEVQVTPGYILFKTNAYQDVLPYIRLLEAAMKINAPS